MNEEEDGPISNGQKYEPSHCYSSPILLVNTLAGIEIH
jgi:hypothetical protein